MLNSMSRAGVRVLVRVSSTNNAADGFKGGFSVLLRLLVQFLVETLEHFVHSRQPILLVMVAAVPILAGSAALAKALYVTLV